MAQRNTIGGDI